MISKAHTQIRKHVLTHRRWEKKKDRQREIERETSQNWMLTFWLLQTLQLYVWQSAAFNSWFTEVLPQIATQES